MNHPAKTNSRNSMRRLGTSVVLFLLIVIALAASLSGQANQTSAAPALPTSGAQTKALPTRGAAQPDVAGLQYGFYMALIEHNAEVRNMGFGWVEYGIFWSDEESSPGSY